MQRPCDQLLSRSRWPGDQNRGHARRHESGKLVHALHRLGATDHPWQRLNFGAALAPERQQVRRRCVLQREVVAVKFPCVG